MIEHIWSVACSQSIIDSDTNNVTLANVIEQVALEALGASEDLTPGQGVVPLQFEIVSLWIRADPEQGGRGLARILIHPPGGEPSPVGEPFDLDLSGYERLRTRSRFGGFLARDSGRYWFIVQKQEGGAEWEEVARVPIHIDIAFPQAPTPAS